MTEQPGLPFDSLAYRADELPVRAPDPLPGRTEDLERLRAALRPGAAVELHGPAGMGKTALAAALAAEWVGRPGGVLWLEGYDDGLLSLLNRVARAYGDEPAGAGSDLAPLLDRVRDALGDAPLIVLDGVIRIEAARELVRALGEQAPVLLTRTRTAPGPWRAQAVMPLSDEDAASVLAASDEGEPAVAAIRARLEGHPFSLHIAARQLAAGVSASNLLSQMPALLSGYQNAAMAILLAAYRVLPADVQGVALLAGTVFGGAATAGLLAASAGAPAQAIGTRLAVLAARGWLTEEQVEGEPIYRAHELVQRFAESFLRAKGRLDALRARHLEGVIDTVLDNMEDGDLDQQRRLAAVFPAVLGSAGHAARKEKIQFLQDLAALLQPTVETSFVAARDLAPEYEWLAALADHPEAAAKGVLPAAPPDTVVEELPAPVTPAGLLPPEPLPAPEREERAPEPMSEAAAPEPVAELAGLDELDELRLDALAEPIVEEDEAGTGDTPAIVDARAQPRAGYPPPDDIPEPAYLRARELTPEVPPVTPPRAPAPEVELPRDYEGLARIGQQARQGSPEEAIGRYRQAAESFKADGKVEDELAALEALAMLSLETDAYADVVQYVDRGVTLAHESDNPQREGQMLVILGDLQAALGRFDGAETAYREAINAFRPSDSWLEIGLALDKLAVLYLDQDQQREAVEVWQQTLPIFERVGRRDLMRESLEAIGDVRVDTAQWDRAQASYRKALEMAEQDGDRAAAFVQLSKLGHVSETRGDRNEAVTYYRRALYLAFALDLPAQRGHLLLALGRLLLDDTAHLNRAMQLLRAADALLPENAEVQRLLSRATTRRDRLVRAGVTLPGADDDLRDYARGALERRGPGPQ